MAARAVENNVLPELFCSLGRAFRLILFNINWESHEKVTESLEMGWNVMYDIYAFDNQNCFYSGKKRNLFLDRPTNQTWGIPSLILNSRRMITIFGIIF